MAINSSLIKVSVLLEQEGGVEEEKTYFRPPWKTENDIRDAVMAALAEQFADRPTVKVSWQSMSFMPLDGRADCGRCAVCNRWVYDAQSLANDTPTGISAGAIVEGRLLCDEHLPPDHPFAF